MSFEKPTVPQPEEVVSRAFSKASVERSEEREFSPEEKKVIIEEALRTLREGAARYEESRRNVEDMIKKLL